MKKLVASKMDQPEADSTSKNKEEENGTTFRVINRTTILNGTKQSLGKEEKFEQFCKRLTHLNLQGTNKKKIAKIENLDICRNLKVLYLYDNNIQEIENLEFAHQLTHLYLQNNIISRMDNMTSLSNLRKLYLEGNQIQRLEGLEKCSKIEELNLSNQRNKKSTSFTFDLPSIEALANSLRILKLSSCNVSSVSELSHLRKLEELDLSNNNVTEIEDAFMLLGSLSDLRNLNLQHNPVCQYPKFSEKAIIFSQRSLEILNGKSIDAKQRLMMQTHVAHRHSTKKQSGSNAPEISKDSNQENDIPQELTTRALQKMSIVQSADNDINTGMEQ